MNQIRLIPITLQVEAIKKNNIAIAILEIENFTAQKFYVAFWGHQ